MRQDKWPWNEFISVFAFVRYFGIDQSIAMTIHGHRRGRGGDR